MNKLLDYGKHFNPNTGKYLGVLHGISDVFSKISSNIAANIKHVAVLLKQQAQEALKKEREKLVREELVRKVTLDAKQDITRDLKDIEVNVNPIIEQQHRAAKIQLNGLSKTLLEKINVEAGGMGIRGITVGSWFILRRSHLIKSRVY